IDLDFARDIREQLILAVYERYGHDHTALVCSFATYRLRSAVRDLGKVLGLPEHQIDALAKRAERGAADTVRAELDRLPELREDTRGPLWDLLVELAAELAGLPRHISQHVGGMIIASQPLIDLVPIQPAAMPGRFICQWDKDSVDDAKFIKIDFLALGMLSLVEECLELIWRHRGQQVDLAALTYDDPRVYDAIAVGDTIGMFQIESRAQIQMLPRTRPRSLDELAVQVAIVRPGPIVGGAVNPYVRRREALRHDPATVIHADHPLLDDILKDTLGIVLYQDQVLEVAIAIGGFTAGQADQFRRSMSRKRSQAAMEQFRAAFLAGAATRGVPHETAEAIFDKLLGFSAFGFPKSHAYAFAVLAYQSAWLRVYYPEEYYAALFNNQPMGFYPPHVLVGDARRHGVHVLRVDINRSAARATPGPNSVLLGLESVQGISARLAERFVAEREANGPYRSLRDLLARTTMSRAVAQNLIAVGALSAFGLSRRELLWQLGLLLPSGAAPQPVEQTALPLPTEQDMVRLPDMSRWERMVADYGLLGLSPSYHPLSLLRRWLPATFATAAAIRALPNGRRVRHAGLVVCRQRPQTAKGVLFLLLEDETGLVNVVVSPQLYDRFRGLLRAEPYLVVTGVVQNREGSLNLIASAVHPMRDALVAAPPPASRSTPPTTTPSPIAGPLAMMRKLAPAGHNFH
ncbi:MAG: OB-fold nucleic acid binding domain-containing protein, partial [Dehalococcoidia bacterium]|nr:OB-fold nucleic acid binding domain-containing protein [Dehalococcoidia bacterium]